LNDHSPLFKNGAVNEIQEKNVPELINDWLFSNREYARWDNLIYIELQFYINGKESEYFKILKF
jgi:hypothetical protein